MIDCVFVCKRKVQLLYGTKYLGLVDGGHIGLETKTLLKQKSISVVERLVSDSALVRVSPILACITKFCIMQLTIMKQPFRWHTV